MVARWVLFLLIECWVLILFQTLSLSTFSTESSMSTFSTELSLSMITFSNTPLKPVQYTTLYWTRRVILLYYVYCGVCYHDVVNARSLKFNHTHTGQCHDIMHAMPIDNQILLLIIDYQQSKTISPETVAFAMFFLCNGHTLQCH